MYNISSNNNPFLKQASTLLSENMIKTDNEVEIFQQNNNNEEGTYQELAQERLPVSYSSLAQEEIMLIKDQLHLKLDSLKSELEITQNSRGVFTNAANKIASVFGKSKDDIKKEEILKLENLISQAEQDPSRICEVWREATGYELDNYQLALIKNSENVAKSLDVNAYNAVVANLEAQIEVIEESYDNAKSSNGWISKTWDNFKNFSGIGASSNKTQAQLDYLKEQVKDLKDNPSRISQVYQNITGENLTFDGLLDLLDTQENKGLANLSKAAQDVEKYSKGQTMVVDTVADMVSGVASVGVVAFGSAIGICAAPFTAGASLSLVGAGLGLAGVAGATVKTAIKASDCIGNDKKYTLKNAAYDTITGAANGMMAPLSNALGGALGTGIMKAAGLEALETQIIKSSVLTGTTALLEQAGKKTALSAGQIAIKTLATGASMAVDGGLSGMMDAVSRDIANKEDFKTIIQDGIQGTIAGVAGGVVIGGAFKGAGKLGSFLGETQIAKEFGKSINSTTDEIAQALSKEINDLSQNSKLISSIASNLDNLSQNINSKAIKTSLKNCLSVDSDGIYNVRIGDYTVKLAKEELSDEILAAIANKDNTLIYNYALVTMSQALDNIDDEIADTINRELSQEFSQTNSSENPQALNSSDGNKKGFVEKIKESAKEKIKKTKTAKKITESYEKAKANFLNVPEVESPDKKVIQEFGEYISKIRDIATNEESFTAFADKLIDNVDKISQTSNGILDDIAKLNDSIAQLTRDKTSAARAFLENLKNGADVSEEIKDLSLKGIDFADFIDEKTIKLLDSIKTKLDDVTKYSDEYAQLISDELRITKAHALDIVDIVQDAQGTIKDIPNTKAFEQLGDMPKRTKAVFNEMRQEAEDLKAQSELINKKLKTGDIQSALKDLEQYYDKVDAFYVKLDNAALSAQDTAQRAGAFETTSTLIKRANEKLTSEGFDELSTAQKAQALIEESNIALPKFIQTMSSDETLPNEVRSFFKEFTSNCTTSRTIKEAQILADELYGAGKYTIKKSFGAGSIGETYLVSDENGSEFVMKILKEGVTKEKFEADRKMFTQYIEEFTQNELDKEYKLKLINGLFDGWEKELDYSAEAKGASEMLKGAKRFNVAQTLEVGCKDGNNISLIMEKADGVGLDTLIDLLKFKNEHPGDYLTLSILSEQGKELNPWIKNSKLIEDYPWIKNTQSYAETLPVAYQKAQNEQSMFLSSTGSKTVHADPHGGNVFVDFDIETNTPKITYIDTGNVITRTNSEILGDITLSLNMIIGNSEGIATSLLDGATLPSGMTQQEAIEKVAKLLDDRLYQAGVNLKDLNYSQSTMMGILSELNIIPDAGNSNLLKANLQRIKTSREIFSVTNTEANKSIDIKDMLTGIKQSFKSNPKETIKAIKPIIKWAYKNQDQTLTTFFQMMLKNSDFN